MNGPSKHLSWKELACKDGTPYPERFIKDGRVFNLAQVFEEIRELCGNKPITVLSAYRTPTWNKLIGGAKLSQHVQGRALDLKPPGKMRVDEFHSIIRRNADRLGIMGIGRYTNFVHIDIRLSDKLVSWRGTGVKEWPQS